MRLIGLAVVFAVSILLAALAAGAQWLPAHRGVLVWRHF
jgi:hypothetical protein